MSNNQPVGFDDLMSLDDTEFDSFPAWGGRFIRIGSLSSAAIAEWLESNENAATKKTGGLRLIVRSLVDAEGNRVPEDKREAMVESLRQKNARMNGAVVARCLKLNGLDTAARL